MRAIACLVLICLVVASGAARADRLTLFAAASTKTAIDSVAAAWRDHSGHDLIAVYGGSSALARQIAAGAPADAFLSANAAWMDDLAGRGLLADGTRRALLGNRLVIIAHPEAPTLDDLQRLAELPPAPFAMALVDAVPAGIYGKAALTALGLWQALAPQIVQTDNVRAALALVALGEAPFGLVYATDARAEPRVRVVAQLPEDSHPPIIYPIAAVRGGNEALASAFLNYLGGPEARAIFAAQGFVAP